MEEEDKNGPPAFVESHFFTCLDFEEIIISFLFDFAAGLLYSADPKCRVECVCVKTTVDPLSLYT